MLSERPQADDVKRALIVGDPDASLPGAREETERIASLLSVTPYVGEAASEALVRSESNRSALIHLAAHGKYLPSQPIFSHFRMAPGDAHDGVLEMHEVWDQLELSGARLVTLSACETGIGRVTRGDEVVGLTQAFLVAGSRAVLSTLWRVEDRASTVLMERFYETWLTGLPADTALREAQLTLMEDYPPYYWAGYMLTGDPDVRWTSADAAGQLQ